MEYIITTDGSTCRHSGASLWEAADRHVLICRCQAPNLHRLSGAPGKEGWFVHRDREGRETSPDFHVRESVEGD